jgi:hypothetical protein
MEVRARPSEEIRTLKRIAAGIKIPDQCGNSLFDSMDPVRSQGHLVFVTAKIFGKNQRTNKN